MAAKHMPARRAKSRVRTPSGAQHGHLDWSDLAAVRKFMLGLSVHFDDLDGVMQDALRPERQRELGPVQHRRIYGDCRSSILAALRYGLPPKSALPAT